MLRKIWTFYCEGFRRMTWGKTLWWLIALKVLILFGILRPLFFKPALSGLEPQEKVGQVERQLLSSQP